MKKQYLQFKVLLFSLIGLLLIQCGNYNNPIPKGLNGGDAGFGFANTILIKKILRESLKDVTVDFSGINEDLHGILRYRTKTTKTFIYPLFPFLIKKKNKFSDWKKIPSKKINIKEKSYIEISLKDSIGLGDTKITSDTKIKIKDIMGSDKKVKNFKYLVLSLNSEKSGEIDISKDDLKELKDQEIDFDQSYDDFKKDEDVQDILSSKTTATDDEVENFEVDN